MFPNLRLLEKGTKPLIYWIPLTNFKNWITPQLYGDTTSEKYASLWEFHHSFLLSSFNLLDANEKKKVLVVII